MKNTQTQQQSSPSSSNHVIYKLPPGDSPYVHAKHVQLVEKDPEAAIVLFMKAIEAGDRVDSALKDMAIVLKQQDRAQQAIEAVQSFRHLCSKQAQESLDNVLFDLYKKCGRVDDQIELLKERLRMIYKGEAFKGKPTKTARSHGKKFQVNIKQETSRIMGNLGWAYMHKGNYRAAEFVYRKAQLIDPDVNKAFNLCLCLIKQAQFEEARSLIYNILQGKIPGYDDKKSRKRAEEMLCELETCCPVSSSSSPSSSSSSSSSSTKTFVISDNLEDDFIEGLEQFMTTQKVTYRSRRLPIFEEISSLRDQLAC